MGLLDDTLRQVAQSNQLQPFLANVLQELLRGASPDTTAPASAPSAPSTASPPSAPQASTSEFPNGLADLLAKLEAAGLGDQVKSWVGTGQNAPVEPGDLGSALGAQTITKMADHAGVSQDDLLTQLAKVLPGLVDKLTPDGRFPTSQRGG